MTSPRIEDIQADPEGVFDRLYMFMELVGDLESLNKEQENRIEQLLEETTKDARLKGLYNPASIREKGEGIIRERQEKQDCLTAIVMDVNKFKSINDNYGHAVGDQVLARIADILGRVCRTEGDLILRPGGNEGEEVGEDISEASAGRLGGDEFVILLPGASELEAMGVLGRIKTAILEDPVVIKNEDGEEERIEVHISGGVAVWKEPEEPEEEPMTIDGLLEIADKAMYEEKRGKKGEEE